MYFVPQFTEATDIITLESVIIFPMRFCVYLNKFIASSSNNIFYIQIHHFTQKTMLHQKLYYTIRYLAVLYLFSQHASRYFWVTQEFVNYGKMPVVKKSLFRVAITYIIFKYTILRSQQCWINRCITRYNILNLTRNLRGVVTTRLGSRCHNK